MMEQIDNGGQAFPSRQEEDDVHNSNGMSLRDYFAAHASKEDVEMAVNRMSQTLPKTRGEISVGEARYNHADHMLAARRIPATQPEGK